MRILGVFICSHCYPYRNISRNEIPIASHEDLEPIKWRQSHTNPPSSSRRCHLHNHRQKKKRGKTNKFLGKKYLKIPPYGKPQEWDPCGVTIKIRSYWSAAFRKVKILKICLFAIILKLPQENPWILTFLLSNTLTTLSGCVCRC